MDTDKGKRDSINLSRLIRGSLVYILAALGLAGLFAIGFFYFEPVKAKNIKRWVRDQIETIFAEDKQRQGDVVDYQTVKLRRDDRRFTGSENFPVRLMDMQFKTDSQHPTRKVSVNLDGQTRHAITGVVPFNFSYDLRVPRNGSLWFAVNREGEDSSTGGLSFTVQVSNEVVTESLYNVGLPPGHTGWKDGAVDLSDFGGQEAKIQFSVEDSTAASDASHSENPVKAYWSGLFVGSRAQPDKKPNIFLIMIDTLRFDHLSCYGYERPTSPNIDKLAAEGVRFENAFSSAPWTNPSILALFAGLNPSDVWEPKPHKEAIGVALPTGVDTLAETLSANGYFTIAASDHPGINQRLFGQGFDIYTNLDYVNEPRRGWRDTSGEKVLKQLRDLLEGRSGSPVFTYIHLIYPHKPYEPPPPYDDDGYFEPLKSRSDSEKRTHVINMYDGEIKRTDDVLGDFFVDIRRLNLDDDSIIVFLSDHGEGFGEHGLVGHGSSLYNELLHVPLILRAPGRLPQGRTIERTVRVVDILPTVLELAGIGYDSRNYRGTSLLPLIKGEENSARLAFSEFPHSRIVFGRAIQSATEKLIAPNGDGNLPEYYDVAEDPKELKNLSVVQPLSVSNLMTIMDDISNGRYQPQRIRQSRSPPCREARAIGRNGQKTEIAWLYTVIGKEKWYQGYHPPTPSARRGQGKVKDVGADLSIRGKGRIQDSPLRKQSEGFNGLNRGALQKLTHLAELG